MKQNFQKLQRKMVAAFNPEEAYRNFQEKHDQISTEIMKLQQDWQIGIIKTPAYYRKRFSELNRKLNINNQKIQQLVRSSIELGLQVGIGMALGNGII